MLTMSRRAPMASSTKPRVPAVSRNWQTVSKAIQKLAAGVLVVKKECSPMRSTMSSQLMKKSSDWSRYTLWREWMRRRLMVVLAPYQPELHYMRGRGPKWREKHASPAR